MPFIKREPKQQGYIQKLFGFKHMDALSADVEALIATRWPTNVPSRAEIAEIETRHGILLAARGISIARKILQMAADSATSRLPLSVPLQNVENLAASLGVELFEATRAIKSSGLKLLNQQVKQALEDKTITQAERDALHIAASELRLTSDDVAAAIVQQIAPLYSARVHQALADGQLSPEEERDLETLAKNLGLTPKHDAKLQEAMNRARTYWNVLHGPLPIATPPFYLQKDEQCTFTANAQVFERRTRTRSVGYAGTSVSIPIVKGVRFRIAQGRVHRQTEEYQHSFGTGIFCATDKRLIWSGPNKNISINLKKIIDFEPFTDGVHIVKDSGKPLLFQFTTDEPYFGPLLSRLLNLTNE